MGAKEVHMNDVGLTLQVQFADDVGEPHDVSSATTVEVHFQKPNKEYIVRSANFLTDGRDGNVVYSTASGDLDQIGFWRIQGYVANGPYHKYSDIQKFRVFPNLPLA